MVFSNKRMRMKACGLAAAGSLLACSSQDSVAPTDLPIPDSSSVYEEEFEEGVSDAVTNPAYDSPPRIDRLTLAPRSPTEGQRLSAIVVASDAQGDPIRLHFRWTVDGQRIDNTGPDFVLQDVVKGSWVKVVVVASDPSGTSEPRERQVTVANRPPELREIVFQPMGDVSSENDITAIPRAFDPDGDEVTYRYLWRINGNDSDVDSGVLSANHFRRGDEIVLEVIANDGEEDSEPLESAAIYVANAQPRIVSVPSDFGGDRFSYLLRVEDPDGDRALRFRLTEGPEGMTIDEISGKISWAPNLDQEGAHPVAVRVRDGQGGEDVQHFQLTLGFEVGETPAALDR